MKRMWSTMMVAAGLFATTGCADGGPTVAGTDDPGAPAAGEYLFGLSEAELLAILPLAGAEHDAASWLAYNRAPFRCERYGDLCAMVGEPAAQELTRDALYLAVGGASLDEVVAEMDRATTLARELHALAPDSGLLRASDTGTALYDCGNHRLRTETFKVNPVIGSRYGQVTCKHQADLGSGIWGGSQDADELEAYVEIVGTGEHATASQTDVHKLTSPKVYPGANQTVRGECTGTHNGDTVTRAVSVS